MTDATLPGLLATRAANDPDRVAMTVHGTGSLTFGQWASRSDAVAAGLVERGVAPGDRVGLVFGNGDWLEYVVAFMGVGKAGAVAVPLSDRVPRAQADAMLAHCGASTVLRPDRLPYASGSVFRADRSDLAQILYTSGTTGRPKGVAATHANLAYGCGGKRRPFAHSKHLVHAFPVGTNAGQWMLVNAVDAHPQVVTLPRFTPGRFAALIEHYRAGTVFLVPAMAIELLAAGAPAANDLSSVLLLGSAAAPLPSRVAVQLSEAFPNSTITNYYTSTEASPAQTVMLFDPDRPASVGRPASGGAVKIATPTGVPLPPGVTGEVWMRCPAATRAYYGDPEASGEVFRAGWVRMGDVGYLDEDGFLYLVDRESDVIKSGAFKVSTIHVEDVLHQHPGVVEAAAYGMPHPTLGKAVAVALVGSVAHEELRIFLKDRLAPHELPVRLVTLDSLPRNHGGKIDKRALREVAT